MNQGNLLRGIDNCLGAARSVVQVHWKALDNSFSNNFSLVQKRLPKKLLMVMAIRVVEFSSWGYKIRNVFA